MPSEPFRAKASRRRLGYDPGHREVVQGELRVGGRGVVGVWVFDAVRGQGWSGKDVFARACVRGYVGVLVLLCACLLVCLYVAVCVVVLFFGCLCLWVWDGYAKMVAGEGAQWGGSCSSVPGTFDLVLCRPRLRFFSQVLLKSMG